MSLAGNRIQQDVMLYDDLPPGLKNVYLRGKSEWAVKEARPMPG
eukprot:CAMPEP_0201519078 /NCGR_PEP_ID=MMETSP0161_2-20130828/9726_1 /ASSEMBLY_ACC=CAM_ASM_000251 /TAXON_ID=180227 /ORGANISM="Neoparamoeba aestuarina, Strain SoJaBio B1-5/56/2" /LENGTH=43 /DNA_ID= /DNA_START= /DNA_END= /DNA_ORIENTATION=